MSHHCLDGSDVNPRAQEFRTVRGAEFVQIPVFAFPGFAQATFAFAAIQASRSDKSLQGSEHMPIRMTVLREDKRPVTCVLLLVSKEPLQQIVVQW